MSTRASIIIKDESESYILYCSSDGYPEYAGVRLKEILESFDYTFGHRIVTAIVRYNERSNHLLLAGHKYYPFEIYSTIPSDIEYLYIIDVPTMDITCYSTGRLIGVYDKFTEELIIENCETREIPDKERGE